MKILTHGTKVIFCGKRGTVGTVQGFAFASNMGIEECVLRAIENRHDLCWINQEASVLCGDKGYYERDKARWANAIVLENNDTVLLDGKLMIAIYKGDYSDMGTFQHPV